MKKRYFLIILVIISVLIVNSVEGQEKHKRKTNKRKKVQIATENEKDTDKLDASLLDKPQAQQPDYDNYDAYDYDDEEGGEFVSILYSF